MFGFGKKKEPIMDIGSYDRDLYRTYIQDDDEVRKKRSSMFNKLYREGSIELQEIKKKKDISIVKLVPKHDFTCAACEKHFEVNEIFIQLEGEVCYHEKCFKNLGSRADDVFSAAIADKV